MLRVRVEERGVRFRHTENSDELPAGDFRSPQGTHAAAEKVLVLLFALYLFPY